MNEVAKWWESLRKCATKRWPLCGLIKSSKAFIGSMATNWGMVLCQSKLSSIYLPGRHSVNFFGILGLLCLLSHFDGILKMTKSLQFWLKCWYGHHNKLGCCTTTIGNRHSSVRYFFFLNSPWKSVKKLEIENSKIFFS